MNISDLLLSEAIKQGLCQTWQDSWNGEFSALMGMYKKGIDFCIKNDYPSLDILRRYLKGKTEDYNIFIDSETEVEVYNDTIVALGDSKLNIWVADYGVVSLYLLHNANVSVFCGEHSIVSIETYNDSKLRVQSPSGKASVFQYDNSSLESKDPVKLFKKFRDAT